MKPKDSLTRRRLLATLTAAVAGAGLSACARRTKDGHPTRGEATSSPPPEAPAGTPPEGPLEELGELPNPGLQPPAVSPDGRWIAYLDAGETAESAAEPDGVPRGASLRLRPADSRVGGSVDRAILADSASWPAWASDGRRGVAVVRPASGPALLAFFSTEVEAASRWSPGWRFIATPTFSPSGERLAVVGSPESPTTATLFVVEPRPRRTRPVPPPTGVEWQALPAWIDEDTLLYVGGGTDGVALYGDSLRTPGPHRVATLPIEGGFADAVGSQSGLFRAFAPERHRFACYDSRRDAIVLFDLLSEHRTPLERGSRAGGWDRSGGFLYATEEALCNLTDAGSRHVLARGAWLPVWVEDHGGEAILLRPSADVSRLAVVGWRRAGP